MKWYEYNQADLFKALHTSSNGLTVASVKEYQKRDGPNIIGSKKKKSFFLAFLRSLADTMTIVLFIASAVSYAVSHINRESPLDAFVIIAIVLINGLVSTVQEYKAEKSLDALKKLSSPEAKVIRGGACIAVNTVSVVAGDIIVLEKGCSVPADARIIESTGLVTDESALTGESAAVYKTDQPISCDGHITSMRNMVFSGTFVTGGHGKACVTSTGSRTYMGGIAKALDSESGSKTPLQKRLDSTGTMLGNAALLICALIFVVSVLKGLPATEMFLTSVSLAVAAIPEGLPAIVTVMLSLGVTKMAKHNAIVKRLPAVETLGCATVICSDKTGTLTCNRMKVQTVSGNEELLKKIFLFNNSCSSPTETALLCYAEGFRIPRAVLIAEIPFDSETKIMITLHKTDRGYFASLKGAPEAVIPHLESFTGQRAYAAMIESGFRVLCFGYAELTHPTDNLMAVTYKYAGLAGLDDPLRDEVAESVRMCHEAGIKTVMITGDHPETALSVAKKAGIGGNAPVVRTQKELEAMSEAEQNKAIYRSSVFARTTPHFKLKIIEVFKNQGETVAMTGDGVNDAPALKKSDIGCAMGKAGTDVAKEACDIVLTDDNFSTIVNAVSEGRTIYANIKRAVHFLISCNIGEISVVFIAILMSLPAPLSALQLLLVNLVTDSLPAIAMGFEKSETDTMRHPPIKKSGSLFSVKAKLLILCEGLFIGILSLVAYRIGVKAEGATLGRTMAFCTLSASQLFHAVNMRTSRPFRSLLLHKNPFLCFSFLISGALILSSVLVPQLAAVFGNSVLSAKYLRTSLVFSALPLAVGEAFKLFCSIIRRFGSARRKNEHMLSQYKDTSKHR